MRPFSLYVNLDLQVSLKRRIFPLTEMFQELWSLSAIALKPCEVSGEFDGARKRFHNFNIYLLDALKFRPVVVEFGSFYLRASIQGPNG